MDTVTADQIRITPVTGTFGAKIEGLDIAGELTPETVELLRRALQEHRLIFFPRQLVDTGQLVEFARRFGTLLPGHPIKPCLPGYPEVWGNPSGNLTEWDSTPRDRYNRFETAWHSDGTFLPEPPSTTMLYAKQVPAAGGDTMWTDLANAYDRLSAPLRKMVDELRAVHDPFKQFAPLLNGDTDERIKEGIRKLSPTVHPLVRVDPVTKRRSLLLNPTCVTHIEGLTQLESDLLIDLLLAHTLIPERTVRWKWHEGDIALWDNQSITHNVVLDYGEQERLLYRLTYVGKPIEGHAGA
ncbi:TauD/TfdA dioxygenase family protein [Streptomyces inhibens]|uniref:TauD/TfdA dioxygenase family protein n=1 Tax=Streptomyces inhibens TaxID=2293571 RepID=UPI001EE77F75|nr:TauD/TfdA family dioxygenase [Streptomyces inhibens]UKY54132.1 TauD/TfdA family dioxygenase [Streptomyces inhibens]